MKIQRFVRVVLVLVSLLGASNSVGQTLFWHNVNHQQDSIILKPILSNPRRLADTIRVAPDSIRIDSVIIFDTAFVPENIGTKTFLSQRTVNGIVILPNGNIVLATDTGILISSDAAESWTINNSGLAADPDIRALWMRPPNILYVSDNSKHV